MWPKFRAFVIHIFWDMPDYRHSGRPFLNSRWRPGIMSIPFSYESIYYKVYVLSNHYGPPVVNIFWHMADYILTVTIFKFKMAAGYHVDSDGYPASYEFIYIKLQVCQFWCFYHKMHNPTKKWSLAAVLVWGTAVALWLERATDNRVVAGSNPAEAVWKLWQFPLPPLCQCLSEETLKAVGPFHGAIQVLYVTQMGVGGGVSDFLEKCVTKVWCSMLLVLRGGGWGSNFQKNSVT